MTDCSHSIAGEKIVGQTGVFSYTAPAKVDLSSVEIINVTFTIRRTLPEIGARKFLCQTGVHLAVHHDS
jgi:hypothetical protein